MSTKLVSICRSKHRPLWCVLLGLFHIRRSKKFPEVLHHSLPCASLCESQCHTGTTVRVHVCACVCVCMYMCGSVYEEGEKLGCGETLYVQVSIYGIHANMQYNTAQERIRMGG